MNEDVEKWLKAINEDYDMTKQYKYALDDLLKTRKLKDGRIFKNFRLLINWMEKKFSKTEFHNIIEKSYDLNDPILYTIRETEENCKSSKNRAVNELQNFEKWLMSDIFRHVTNPDIENYPDQKYVGQIKFTKIKTGYEGESDIQWTPNQRDSVDDIKMVVYLDDEMKNERRYEEEHGWKDEWYAKKIYNLKSSPADKSLAKLFAKFQSFKTKWAELKEKAKIPGWYYFDPLQPVPRRYEERYGWKAEWETQRIYNLPTDKLPTEFLDFEKKWNEAKKKKEVPEWYYFDPRAPKFDDEKKPKHQASPNHNKMKDWDLSMFNFLKDQKWYKNSSSKQEVSELVVDCNQLLGIGGEGIVIRRSIAEKIYKENESKRLKTDETEYEAVKIIPLTAENFESVCQDIRTTSSDMKNFYNNNLMRYRSVQLDFIDVFGEKTFVMLIGNYLY